MSSTTPDSPLRWVTRQREYQKANGGYGAGVHTATESIKVLQFWDPRCECWTDVPWEDEKDD